MTALERIAAALEALAENASDDHPIDPFEVRVIARQVAAQAEMEAQGLVS